MWSACVVGALPVANVVMLCHEPSKQDVSRGQRILARSFMQVDYELEEKMVG